MDNGNYVKELEEMVERLIHAYEDEIDNYPEIDAACAEAKILLWDNLTRKRKQKR